MDRESLDTTATTATTTSGYSNGINTANSNDNNNTISLLDKSSKIAKNNAKKRDSYPIQTKRRKYDTAKAAAAATTKTTNEDAASKKFWHVKKVIGKKIYKNTIYYKVLWVQGDEPSWIKEQDCSCDYLIREYEQQCQNSSDEDEWEVEKILDKRIRDGEVEYLVKWKYWPGPPTWESAKNCDCVNLIAAFENPKLRKLWNFSGSNTNLWVSKRHVWEYMQSYIRTHNYQKTNLLRFQPDSGGTDERPLSLIDGLNIGALRYYNHWYLVIVLKNHICVTRRILVGDPLNTLIGVNANEHPVVKRLGRVYSNFQIRPMRLTQMDRSDVCAFYTLAAFERALFLFRPNAQFIVESIYFDSTRAELIRSEIKPDTAGEISASLPIPKAFDHGPMCEFCEQLFESRRDVDEHIKKKHFSDTPATKTSRQS